MPKITLNRYSIATLWNSITDDHLKRIYFSFFNGYYYCFDITHCIVILFYVLFVCYIFMPYESAFFATMRKRYTNYIAKYKLLYTYLRGYVVAYYIVTLSQFTIVQLLFSF